jgi:hypothetical protein
MTEAYDVEFIKLYQALGEYTSDDLKGAQGYPSPKAMLSMHMDAVAYQFEYKEIPQEKQPDLPMNMPEGLPDSALNPVAPMDTQAAVMDGSGNGG